MMTTDNEFRRFDSGVTFSSLLERTYRDHADRIATRAEDGSTVTYGALGERAHRIAGGLRARGIESGDRGLLLIGNLPQFFEVDHALMVGGFVRSALSVRLHIREVEHIAQDCTARVLFAERAWAQRIIEAREAFPTVDFVVSVDGAVDGAIELDDLVAEGVALDPIAARPHDPLAILYTSGTTGLPKGATLSQANWLAMARNLMVELPPLHHSDVLLHVAPLSHLSGYLAPTFVPHGASNLTLPHFDPAQVLDVIERHRVTAVALVPTMLNLLLLEAEQRPRDTSSLRVMLYGGSPIAPDRLARAIDTFGNVFVQVYGLSETPMPLTCLTQRDHELAGDASVGSRLSSAGRPSPFVEVRLVTDGVDAPPGSVGEIMVRGDTVMLGYWAKPEETRQMIDDDGWASTGDLGRFDTDGYLTIVDRIKYMVVTGGFNVYPTEIEKTISQLPAVLEVAVVGVPDDRWGEALKAVIVVRPDHELTGEEVLRVCTENLASYKKPQSVEFVDSLPKTGSGKIMRRQIRDQYWAGRQRQVI